MSHLPPASSSTSTSQTDMAMAASSSATSSNSPFNQFGDTTLTKVFVGGLAWETQRDTMRRYFEQFGEILEAVVITDKTTGRSKGYGFVTFRDPEGARRACADPTPVIDGRRANCNLASLGVRSRPGTPQHGGRFRATSPYAGGSSSGLQVYSGAPATTFSQPLPYAYHQSFPYPPYGYPMYHPEYPYPTNMYNAQNMYSPYATTQFPAVYGGPSSATGVYPYPFSQAPQITTGFSPQQQQQQQQSGYGLQAAPQLVPYASPGVSTISSLSPFGGTAVPLQIQSTGFSPDLLSPSGLSGNAPQFAMQPSPTQQPQFPSASGGSQQSSS